MAPDDERDLVEALRGGDDAAFVELVEGWSGAMQNVARGFVSSTETAQDVVQDTWVAVIRGIDRFEGRSSLRTWVFRILINTAKTRGVRDSKVLPFSSLSANDDTGPTVDPSRFRGPDDQWAGGWTEEGRPQAWASSAESIVLDRELGERIEAA